MNLTKCRRHVLSYSMCLVEKLQQKVEDSGGFDLDASPATEELDSRSVNSLHRALSRVSLSWRGTRRDDSREGHREVGDKEMWSQGMFLTAHRLSLMLGAVRNHLPVFLPYLQMMMCRMCWITCHEYLRGKSSWTFVGKVSQQMAITLKGTDTSTMAIWSMWRYCAICA